MTNIDLQDQILSVLNALEEIDPATAAELKQPDSVGLRDSYLRKHVLPVAQIECLSQVSRSNLHLGLACHLIWTVFWRSLDNAIDSNNRTAAELGDTMKWLVRANMATNSVFKLDLSDRDRIENLVTLCCDIWKNERDGSLRSDDIWMRAAPYFIVPETCWRWSERQLDIYKSYINVIGFHHDCLDLFDDFHKGIISTPRSIFLEITEDMELTPTSISDFFIHAARNLRAKLARLDSLTLDLEFSYAEENVRHARKYVREILGDTV